MKCDVINLDNETVGAVDLDDAIFGVEVRRDLLARVVNWQLAKRRAGTHKTKTRAEVRGSRQKPFRQKGTGRARQGTKMAPTLRGGGIAFGPVVRDHTHSVPKKVRKLALKSAISSKLAEGKLIILESTKLESAKTKELVARLDKLAWGSTLIIDGAEVDATMARASSNIIGIDLLPSQGANVYDILRRDTLVLTKDGVEKLVERLK